MTKPLRKLRRLRRKTRQRFRNWQIARANARRRRRAQRYWRRRRELETRGRTR